LAVSFVSPDTEAHWRLIEKRQNISVPREVEAGFEPQTIPVPSHPLPNPLLHPLSHPLGTAHDPSGGMKGKRPNKKDKLRMAQQQTSGQ
jgi:hypothetical protein